jgi:hypothetical protein
MFSIRYSLYTTLVHQESSPLADSLKDALLDHLIATAFSLWRAVFLTESERDLTSIQKSQKTFLASVITANAITFSDDYKNRAWTVSYYLETAKLRLWSAYHLAEQNVHDDSLHQIPSCLGLIGTYDKSFTRHEWDIVHYALRVMFKLVQPKLSLVIVRPTLPSIEA